MTDSQSDTRIDPISISVFQRRLRTITEEMALTLLRTQPRLKQTLLLSRCLAVVLMMKAYTRAPILCLHMKF